MPTSYINLHTSPLDLNYANRVPYEVSGLVYWLDPQRWNDPAAPWTLNGTKVASAPSRESSAGVIDATKTAAQGTDAQRPTLNTSDANYGGRATLSFSSASSQAIATGAWGASVAQPTTIYVVGETTGIGNYFVDGVAVTAREAIFQGASAFWSCYAGTATVSSTTDSRVSGPTVLSLVLNGASSNLYERDPANAIITGNPGSHSLTGITLGARYDYATSGLGYLNGKIATVLVYSGAHDQATRTRIMNWLSDRYGFNRSLTPYTVGGLAYWLDPERYADTTGPGAWTLNGTKVATAVSRHSWAGVADTSKNVTQATDSARPTINVADSNLGGRNSLSFVGASAQFLASGTWTNTFPMPYTVYLVTLPSAADAAVHHILDGLTAANRWDVYMAATTGRMGMQGSAGIVGASTSIASTANVLCAAFNGASSAGYINNSSSADFTGNTGTSTPTGTTIGRAYTGTLPYDGKLAAILIYSGAHTAAQRALIMQWLGSRYGVTVT